MESVPAAKVDGRSSGKIENLTEVDKSLLAVRKFAGS